MVFNLTASGQEEAIISVQGSIFTVSRNKAEKSQGCLGSHRCVVVLLEWGTGHQLWVRGMRSMTWKLCAFLWHGGCRWLSYNAPRWLKDRGCGSQSSGVRKGDFLLLVVVWIGNMKEGRRETQAWICADQTIGMWLDVRALWTLGRWNSGCRSDQHPCCCLLPLSGAVGKEAELLRIAMNSGAYSFKGINGIRNEILTLIGHRCLGS